MPASAASPEGPPESQPLGEGRARGLPGSGPWWARGLPRPQRLPRHTRRVTTVARTRTRPVSDSTATRLPPSAAGAPPGSSCSQSRLGPAPAGSASKGGVRPASAPQSLRPAAPELPAQGQPHTHLHGLVGCSEPFPGPRERPWCCLEPAVLVGCPLGCPGLGLGPRSPLGLCCQGLEWAGEGAGCLLLSSLACCRHCLGDGHGLWRAGVGRGRRVPPPPCPLGLAAAVGFKVSRADSRQRRAPGGTGGDLHRALPSSP